MKCSDCHHWYCNYDLEAKPMEGEPLRCQPENIGGKENNMENRDMNWAYCVSTASSFLSLDWEEHFFASGEEADAFERKARKRGKATLKVSADEY